METIVRSPVGQVVGPVVGQVVEPTVLPTVLPEINCIRPTIVCPQRKYRIVCEEAGFIPHTVKTWIKGNMLHVLGLVRCMVESGVYTQREFKRCYELPRYVCVEKMVTLFNEHGQLIIELPLVDVEALECGKLGGLVLPTHETVQPVSVNILDEQERLYRPIHMGVQPTLYRYNRTIPETLDSRYLLDDRHVTLNTPIGLDNTRFVDCKQYRNFGF